MKSVSCPHCGAKVVPGDSGYRHDEHLNILCEACGKPLMPATEEAEAAILPLFRRPNRNQTTVSHAAYPHAAYPRSVYEDKGDD